MQRTLESINSTSPDRRFEILLGDNAYYNGVKNVDDSQFGLFESLAVGSDIPRHVILGNHDYVGNVSAQIEYSLVDRRWDLPSPYYKRLYNDSGVALCLLFLDTVKPDQVQLDWLDEQLQTPDCEVETAWTIVSGHYPIWSAGIYGDSTYLTEKAVPILHKHKVPLYLCGHEHLHEIFFDGVTVEVVSGATADPRAALNFRNHPLQVWGVSGPDTEGYIRVKATDEKLDVSITSGRSNRDFVSFSIARKNNSNSSMFGHIEWSNKNSNLDAFIATLVPGNSVSFTFPAVSLALCVLAYITTG